MKLSLPSKKMILFICLTALVMIVGGVIFYRSLQAFNFALGVILSSLLNVFKLFLLERTARKTLDMTDPKAGKAYISLQYILRYVLSAAILLVAAVVPFINVMGAVFGIFTLQISVLIVRSMKFPEEPADPPAVGDGESIDNISDGSVNDAGEKNE